MEMELGSSNNTPLEVNSAAACRIFRPDDFLVPPFPPDVDFTEYQEQICYSLDSPGSATHRSVDCVNSKLHVKDSPNSSAHSFLSEWETHEERHCHGAEMIHETSSSNYQVPTPLGSDGSWSDLGSCSLHDESATMVEKEARVGYVATPPNPRRMIEIGSLQNQSYGGVTFSVLSYNILSNLYASCNDHCPSWALAWEYRRENLLRELIGYHADIICLQEVQSDHFKSFFKPKLAQYGYSVLYKEKTTSVYTGSGNTAEGCATFYCSNLFKEITKYEVEFGRKAMSVVELLEPQQRKMGQIHLVKGNVALVVILETVNNRINHHPCQTRICVANTHIVAGRDNEDVKLCQIAHLVEGLEKIAKLRIPILMCGDFNSVPKSRPYRFIVMGKLNCKRAKKADPFGIYRYLKMRHSLPLVSTYSAFFQSELARRMQWKNINHKTIEPLFTCHKPQYSKTLDYIFHTGDSLKVESVLELLNKENIGADYLPSSTWSSDHIALMARFRCDPPYWSAPTILPPNPWL